MASAPAPVVDVKIVPSGGPCSQPALTESIGLSLDATAITTLARIGGNGIDQLFGSDGNDLLLFGAQSEGFAGGTGIDALSVTQADVRFVNFDQNTSGIETVDMRNGAANSVTLNAADVLDFGGTTGETVNGNTIDLVVRGDTGATADTLHLQQTGGVHFALDTSGVALNDPAFGGPGTLYNVFSNGTENVAVEDGVTVTV